MTETLFQALGKTLGTGDDDGDQDVIHKFLRVRQDNNALYNATVAAIHVVVHYLSFIIIYSIDLCF